MRVIRRGVDLLGYVRFGLFLDVAVNQLGHFLPVNGFDLAEQLILLLGIELIEELENVVLPDVAQGLLALLVSLLFASIYSVK